MLRRAYLGCSVLGSRVTGRLGNRAVPPCPSFENVKGYSRVTNLVFTCHDYLHLTENFIFNFFCPTVQLVGSQFPDQGLNPGHISESPES